MNSQLILFIFLILAIIVAIDVTRRALTAIIMSTREKNLMRMIKQLRRPKQPSVTVLVYGKNQARELEQTVRQVRRSRYSMFDIVAISDRSADDSVERLKSYISKVKQTPTIAILQRRAKGTKMAAYKAAYRKSQHGKIVICLTAGDVIDPLFIKRAVVSQTNKGRWSVAVSENTSEDNGLIELMQKLRRLFVKYDKSATVFVAKTFRKSEKLPSKMVLYWAQLALQLGIVVGVVTGTIYGGYTVLWYSWILFSVYLFTLIWLQSETSSRQKWKFTFSVPSALFLMPVVGFTAGIAQLHIRK